MDIHATAAGWAVVAAHGCVIISVPSERHTDNRATLAVVMAATLVPIILIWFNSEAILLGLKQEPEVAHLAATYLKWATIGLPAYAFNGISRRYFQSQGLFDVPTRVIICVAPVNALLNWVLVWGPKSVRLGFIGAPIATAISFNLISVCSIIYGVWFVPTTAWHPISRRCFTSLGVLVQLGLAGVGECADARLTSLRLMQHRRPDRI